jgi:hypothetical protein
MKEAMYHPEPSHFSGGAKDLEQFRIMRRGVRPPLAKTRRIEMAFET